MATAAEAATAELFQANLLGVPEVASEDEIRWCFRKWDLMKIDFDQPLKVVVSFESAGDLSAVLASTGNFIIRGQSISIEEIKKLDPVKPVEVSPLSPTISDTIPSNLVDEYLMYMNISEPVANAIPSIETPLTTETASTNKPIDFEEKTNPDSKTTNETSSTVAIEPSTKQLTIDDFLVNKIAELSEENAVGASASVFTEESTNNRIAMDVLEKPVAKNEVDSIESRIAEFCAKTTIEEVLKSPIEVPQIVSTTSKTSNDQSTNKLNIDDLLKNKIAELSAQNTVFPIAAPENVSSVSASEPNNKLFNIDDLLEKKIAELSVLSVADAIKKPPPIHDNKQNNIEDRLDKIVTELSPKTVAIPVVTPICNPSTINVDRTERSVTLSSNTKPFKPAAHPNTRNQSAGGAPIKYVEEFRRPNYGATAKQPAASIVAKEPPIKPGMCLFCGQSSAQMCSACGRFYCSTACQTIDWPHHARICSPMPELVAAARLPTRPPPQPTPTANSYGMNTAPVNGYDQKAGPSNVYAPKAGPSNNIGPFNGYVQKPGPSNGFAQRAVPSNGYGPKPGNTNEYGPKAGNGHAPQTFAGKSQQHHRSRSAQRANNYKQSFERPSTPMSSVSTASNASGVSGGHVNPFKKQDVSVIIPSQPQRRSNSIVSDGGSSVDSHLFKNWNELKTPPTRQHAPNHVAVVNPPAPVYSYPAPPIAKPAFNAGPSHFVSTPMPMQVSPRATSFAPTPVVVSSTPTMPVVKTVTVSPSTPPAPQPADSSKSLSFCDFPKSNSLVMISDVISDKHVFVRSISDELDDEYLNTLRAVALYGGTTAKPLVNPPIVGQMILAPNPEQASQMRRSLVLKSSGATLLVAFIDFGAVATPLLADCLDLSVGLQNCRRLIHRCTVDGTNTEPLSQLKAKPLIISYAEPFTASSLCKLTVA